MKKAKWILLAITLALAGLFLFATCRKTKALEDSQLYNNYYNLDGSDSNSSMVIMYSNNSGSSYTSALFRINYSQGYLILLNVYDSVNQAYRLQIASSETTPALSIPIPSDTIYYYVIISYGEDINNNDVLYFTFGLVSWNKTTGFNNNYNIYNLDDLNLDQTVLESDYFNNTFSITPLYYNSAYAYPYHGTINYYIYDSLDYSLTMSEQINDIYNDYILSNCNSLTYNYYYTAGYNSGYQVGYDEGYTAGQTAGYNSGYSVGYQDGLADNTTAYDRGYDDGYADGYRTGYDLGMTDGDAIGYQRGLAEGMAGATPVSQTVGVVSSIFAGIGSVMAIQLFPGFPLGLLILVPLFFAVLGLILWIWRRN